MANQIMRYETILVFNSSLGEEAVAALSDKFKALIEENATVEKVEDWGKRRLAYPIDDELEGNYLLVHFESKPDFPAELNRVCEITEGVLRTLIVRNEFTARTQTKPAAESPTEVPVPTAEAAPEAEEPIPVAESAPAPIAEEPAPTASIEPAADVPDNNQE